MIQINWSLIYLFHLTNWHTTGDSSSWFLKTFICYYPVVQQGCLLSHTLAVCSGVGWIHCLIVSESYAGQLSVDAQVLSWQQQRYAVGGKILHSLQWLFYTILYYRIYGQWSTLGIMENGDRTTSSSNNMKYYSSFGKANEIHTKSNCWLLME